MIVCAKCGFTSFCTYDPVSDTHNFSNFTDVEVDSSDDLVWEKSAPHMKQYIHKTYLGESRYQCSVCKSCVNHLFATYYNVVKHETHI